jgi:hypothetical protein
VVAADGCVSDVALALGPGGPRVVELLDRLAAPARAPVRLAVEVLARATPAGTVDLPVAAHGLDDAVLAAGDVDPAWLAVVDERRSEARAALRAGGREVELEAALNLAMLLATDRLEGGEADLGARVASGARLWLLGAAVSWALTDGDDDPFSAWAELLSYGLWPVGPVGGRLVVSGS